MPDTAIYCHRCQKLVEAKVEEHATVTIWRCPECAKILDSEVKEEE